jgi:hypothetical protein
VQFVYNSYDRGIGSDFFGKKRKTSFTAPNPIDQLAGPGAGRIGADQALAGFF